MRSPILFLSILLALLTTVIASPHPNDHDNDHEDNHSERHGCLNDHDANTLLHRWISFFEKLDPALAAKSVTDDFHLFSESTNAITPNRPPPVRTSPPTFLSHPPSPLVHPYPTNHIPQIDLNPPIRHQSHLHRRPNRQHRPRPYQIRRRRHRPRLRLLHLPLVLAHGPHADCGHRLCVCAKGVFPHRKGVLGV